MSVLDSVYTKLPVLAQHVAVSGYGLYWSWLRFGAGFQEFVQEYLIRIRVSLNVIKETKPMIWNWLLKKYEKIPWEKYIKLGKAIDKGYWALVYSLAWNMASIGVMDIKKVVITILKLKPSKNEIDYDFF